MVFSDCPVLHLCLNSSVLPPVSLSPPSTFCFLFSQAASCVALSLSTLFSFFLLLLPLLLLFLHSGSLLMVHGPPGPSTSPGSHRLTYWRIRIVVPWAAPNLCCPLVYSLHFCISVRFDASSLWPFFCLAANYLVWPRPLPGHHGDGKTNLIWFNLKNQQTLKEKNLFFKRLGHYFGVTLLKHLNRAFYIQILIKTWSKCCTAHTIEKPEYSLKKQSAINPSAFVFSLTVYHCCRIICFPDVMVNYFISVRHISSWTDTISQICPYPTHISLNHIL